MILGRVKELKNLVFVGNKRSTLNAIRTLFEERDLREEHLFSLVDRIRSNGTSSTVQSLNISRMSFIPFNKDIPQTPFAFVYLLFSVNPQTVDTFYVGQTKRALLTRLSEHNRVTDQYSLPHLTDSPGQLLFSFVISTPTLRAVIWKRNSIGPCSNDETT